MTGPNSSSTRRTLAAAPPADVLVLSVLLVAAAGGALWTSVLVQFAGPAVPGAAEPQLLASAGYGVAGLTLLAVAVAVYRRSAAGWFGTASIAVAASTWYVTAGERSVPLVLGFLGVPLCLLAYLVARRDVFLG